MSSKVAVLFVDDEPRILNGLRRSLRAMRHEWDMAFATGGAEALEVAASRALDVAVSDMRMPGMDGVELLREVRVRYPHVGRIALSGQASKDTVLRSIGLVHQYLAKPCEPETLKATVNRVCALRGLVENAELRGLLSGMTALPSLPTLRARLIEQVQAPAVSIDEIAQTVDLDLGMSARVLQLASSAFFTRLAHVPRPDKATVFLGQDIVKALALCEDAFSEFTQASVESLSIDSLWRHSRTVGECAEAIAHAENATRHVADQAFMAGMLHDIGKVVFAAELPGRYASILAASPEGRAMMTEKEREEFGATHAAVGAYLMGLWGLPAAVVEAIALHHDPGRCSTEAFAVVTAAHVANALVRQDGAMDETGSAARIDGPHLASLGLADRLPLWREACQKAMDKEMAHV
jgi:HD-like signal output (HDOD) protein